MNDDRNQQNNAPEEQQSREQSGPRTEQQDLSNETAQHRYAGSSWHEQEGTPSHASNQNRDKNSPGENEGGGTLY